MPRRSLMSLIMGQIDPEHPELFALEFRKMAESDFVYTSIYKYKPISTLASTNVNQLVPNMVTLYMTMTS